MAPAHAHPEVRWFRRTPQSLPAQLRHENGTLLGEVRDVGLGGALFVHPGRQLAVGMPVVLTIDTPEDGVLRLDGAVRHAHEDVLRSLMGLSFSFLRPEELHVLQRIAWLENSANMRIPLR